MVLFEISELLTNVRALWMVFLEKTPSNREISGSLDCWESFSEMPSTELVECWVARKFEFTSPLVYSQLLVQYRLDEMLQNRDILQTDKIASESDYLRSDHDIWYVQKSRFLVYCTVSYDRLGHPKSL